MSLIPSGRREDKEGERRTLGETSKRRAQTSLHSPSMSDIQEFISESTKKMKEATRTSAHENGTEVVILIQKIGPEKQESSS